MAKKRYIADSFWSDSWIEDLDPLEKYLFLYLLTNQYVSVSGIYELKEKRMAFETGIDRDMVIKILGRFQDAGKIFYEDGMVFIVNFIKNQNIKNAEDNLWKWVVREIHELHPQKLQKLLSDADLWTALQGAYNPLWSPLQGSCKEVGILYLTLLNNISSSLRSEEILPQADSEKNSEMDLEENEEKDFSLTPKKQKPKISTKAKKPKQSVNEEAHKPSACPLDPTVPVDADISAGSLTEPEQSDISADAVEYGDAAINAIIRAITDAHGTCDGTRLQQRRWGWHLKNKLDKIKGFNGDYYGFVHTLCTRTSKYHISKTTSPKLIYEHLALLIANLREEIHSNEQSVW